ncbi:MAG: LytTR family DNA-binding domain-containing protein [Bacteroidota bacterium]
MKIVIIEDEALAAERLAQLIRRYDPDVDILASLDAVEQAVEWFEQSDPPDLAFMDIQLADGLSFEIFEKAQVDCPVIFTTAYNEFALRAFKVNSIDYLLKPVDFEELSQAFRQFEALQESARANKIPDQRMIQDVVQLIQKRYKSRMIVKKGHQLISVPTSEVAYFYSEHKAVWMKTIHQKRHLVDYTLEQLEQQLDPAQFFRLNRKYLAAYPAILSATSYSNSRLKVGLVGAAKEEEVLISREKVGQFKAWMDQ